MKIQMTFYTFLIESNDSDGFPTKRVLYGATAHHEAGQVPKFYANPEDSTLFETQNITVIDEFDTEFDKSVLESFDLKEFAPALCVYDREQHYGGGEEGGWYYHTEKSITNLKLETGQTIKDAVEKFDSENDLDNHGEGYILRLEFYKGQSEKMEKQFYC